MLDSTHTGDDLSRDILQCHLALFSVLGLVIDSSMPVNTSEFSSHHFKGCCAKQMKHKDRRRIKSVLSSSGRVRKQFLGNGRRAKIHSSPESQPEMLEKCSIGDSAD